MILSLADLSAIAQDDVHVKTGIINGRAVSLPKPAYPQAAREAGSEGAVAVDVIVDEQGNVVSAVADIYDQRVRKDEADTPAIIDPALRQAAEEAAKQAKFSPMKLGDMLVKFSGLIIYNFVGPTAKVTSGGNRGGVLNGNALVLPKPEYPAAAKAVRAQGTVTVEVTVDDQGNVISAHAVSGHPLLRQAAEMAASGATFSPTTLSGKPVKVTGVLTYNFVLPKTEQ